MVSRIADMLTRDIEKYNDHANDVLVKIQKASPDSEGRIRKAGPVFEIHAEPPSAKSKTGFDKTSVIENLMRHPDLPKEGSSDRDIRDFLQGRGSGNSYTNVIDQAPVYATYNVQTGRICDFKNGRDQEEHPDCFSEKDLMPNTRLAADIAVIKAHAPPAPKP